MLYDSSNSYNLEILLNEFCRLLFDVEKIAPLFSFGNIDEIVSSFSRLVRQQENYMRIDAFPFAEVRIIN
jgi:hypothetical protein